jgi:4'-phosphopantetheinyl transferase
MSECLFEVESWVFRPAETAINPFPVDAARVKDVPDPARRDFAARSRSILRRVLALRLGMPPEEIEFQVEPGGKPRVSGCEFSLSHSGPWLVVVTGGEELGVDVEFRTPRGDAMELARRFFSNDDAAALHNAHDKGRAFILQWVAKEAALKASGVGLAGGLGRARCLFDGAAIREVAWDAERFSIEEFALADGTPGAVAWRHGLRGAIRWRDAAEAGVD